MQTERITACERGSLWVRELMPEDDVKLIEPRCETSFEEASPLLAEALAAAMGKGLLDEVRQRFASGRRCFVACVAGQIAAYCWVTQGPERINELERDIRISQREAYIWQCATLPAYQGQRLYTALLTRIVAQAQREGLTRLWIGTALANGPSLRAFATSGFRPVLVATYLRFLRLTLTLMRAEPEAPRQLVEMGKRALRAPHEHGPPGLLIGWR